MFTKQSYKSKIKHGIKCSSLIVNKFKIKCAFVSLISRDLDKLRRNKRVGREDGMSK